MNHPIYLTARAAKPGYDGSLASYRAEGGYKTWERVLNDQVTREEITAAVQDSGLRGRGGAGFPCGLKWTFMPKDEESPHYLLVNGDESEPGTFKDRVILEKDPHLLIEGAALSAYAIRARTVYVYIRGEYRAQRASLDKAIEEARASGLLGRNLLGSGWDCEIYTHPGAGAYICGEETAQMESIEGKRGHPRPKPPFPAGYGLWGRPTTINNVETISNVPFIVDQGAAAYRQMGTEQSPGNFLVGVSGHVNKPGVYELPLGITAREVIEEVCGGMLGDIPLKAFYVGGSSTGLLPADKVDVVLDHDSVREHGVMLGTGGIVVMNESTCIVRATQVLARFYDHETCGQCSQCRIGTEWTHQILKRIERGEGKLDDLDTYADLLENMSGMKTVCAFADGCVMPLRTALTDFRDEFEAHIEQGCCPVGQAAAEEVGA